MIPGNLPMTLDTLASSCPGVAVGCKRIKSEIDRSLASPTLVWASLYIRDELAAQIYVIGSASGPGCWRRSSGGPREESQEVQPCALASSMGSLINFSHLQRHIPHLD